MVLLPSRIDLPTSPEMGASSQAALGWQERRTVESAA